MDGDPFFVSANTKRSKRWAPSKGPAPKKSHRKGRRDEEIASEDEDDALTLEDEIQQTFADEEEEASDDETLVQETAAEKRLRMAKEIIEQIEEQEKDKELEGELLTQAVSHRLRQEVYKQKGVLRRELANKLKRKAVDPSTVITVRGHRLPITSAVISADTRHVVTASKDGTIIKWLRQSGIRLHTWKRLTKDNRHGHKGPILALALNTEGTFLASAGTDSIINIWDFQSHSHLKCLRGHRGAVNGLSFRLGHNTLFSASDDRTVKVWNIDALTYVETLFGHQDQVLAVDSLHRERAVSCGGRDRTLRLWKIVEASQLVFASTGISLDCIAMLTELHFVSGNQNGALSLWDIGKKKPVCTIARAHGAGNWISAVAAVPYSDLVASGSRNGVIRLWAASERKTRLYPVMKIQADGWINSLQFSADGAYLVAGGGKEHRLGRWDSVSGAKNTTRVFSLRKEALQALASGADEKEDEEAEEAEADVMLNGHGAPAATKAGKTVARAATRKQKKQREPVDAESSRMFASSVLGSTSLVQGFDAAEDEDMPALDLPVDDQEGEEEENTSAAERDEQTTTPPPRRPPTTPSRRSARLRKSNTAR